MVGAAAPATLNLCVSPTSSAQCSAALSQRVTACRPRSARRDIASTSSVEGASGRRLAVECDGDKYHGPERWTDDMRRQRILERVGWRFWRCWASSFTLDPDGCMADLFAILNRMGVDPGGSERAATHYTDHVIAEPVNRRDENETMQAPELSSPSSREPSDAIAIGDRVVIQYLDDRKQLAVTLTPNRDDVVNGLLSIATPLGKELLGRSKDDEIDYTVDGRTRRVLVVNVEQLGKHGNAPLASETTPPTPSPAQKPAVKTADATVTPTPASVASAPVKPSRGASTTKRQRDFDFGLTSDFRVKSETTEPAPRQSDTAKPVSPGPNCYAPGERVSHPKFGFGRVEQIATEEVAGMPIEFIHITFDDNDMKMKVPVEKAAAQELRKVGLSRVR